MSKKHWTGQHIGVLTCLVGALIYVIFHLCVTHAQMIRMCLNWGRQALSYRDPSNTSTSLNINLMNWVQLGSDMLV